MSESIGRTRPAGGVAPIGPGVGSGSRRERPRQDHREAEKSPPPPAEAGDEREPADEPTRGRKLDVRV